MEMEKKYLVIVGAGAIQLHEKEKGEEYENDHSYTYIAENTLAKAIQKMVEIARQNTDDVIEVFL